MAAGSSMTNGPSTADAHRQQAALVDERIVIARVRRSSRGVSLCAPLPRRPLRTIQLLQLRLVHHTEAGHVVVDELDQRVEPEGVGVLVQLVEPFADLGICSAVISPPGIGTLTVCSWPR